MTGRTHDLAAFTALTYIISQYPLTKMTFGTALIAFTANMAGGLAPDIDQPASGLWKKIRGGKILGKILSPLLGGHRYISHSLIGIALFGIMLQVLLNNASSFIKADMNIIWWAFMIGYVSHLVMDSFTKEGVPWLFPIPFKFGFPPLSLLRLKTGGIIEKSFVFPMLIIANIFIFYYHYSKFLDFFQEYITK